MNLDSLPLWLRALVGSMGGLGLFTVAFLDSSVLSFPVFNDLLVIQLSINAKDRMPYYALMATLGSLAGCLVLYFIARKGGEVMFHRRAGHRASRIRGWIGRYGFLSVAIPSILPPPMPFKAFVIAAGVFRVPFRTFLIAIAAGRGLRYFAEGILAVRYGDQAGKYVRENTLEFTLIAVGLIVLSFLVTRLVFGKHEAPLPPA